MPGSGKKIYILGVGHSTGVYIDLAQLCGYEVRGLYHYKKDRIGEELYGIPIIGSNDDLFSAESLEGLIFAVSPGDNIIRSDLSDRIRSKGGIIPTLVHPAASVSRFADLAPGVVVQANSSIQAGAVISLNTVVAFNTAIVHDSIIEAGCFISVGSVVGAYVTIKPYALIGMHSVLISGKVDTIGKHAIVGAGSVVTKSVDDKAIVAGNPARFIRYRDDV